MSQVLGIDIGSYSIKLAFLEIAKSSVILKNVIESPIPYRTQPDEEKLAKIQTLRKMLESINLSALKDNIYAGLGSQHTVLQNFEFLKVSSRNLPKIIENEFDEIGLFAPNEYFVELKFLDKSTKYTKVLGILVKKSAARDVIEILTAAHATCRIIDVECLAFQNLIPFTPQFVSTKSEGTATNLIVNIGHSKTSVVVVEKNQVVLEHSFNLAGHYISSKIQTECQIAYEDAQELKHKIAGKIEFNSENSRKAKEVLIESCTEIGKELERIVLSLTQSKKIEAVLLTGGSAKIANLPQIIDKILGIPTLYLNLSDAKFKNVCSEEFIFQGFSQAIALGLRGTALNNNSDINIRHGELALVSDYENIINYIFSYTKMVAIILVCLLSTYGLRSYLYNNKINQIKNLFINQMTSYFGSEPPELKLISAKANWDFNEYSNAAIALIQKTSQQKMSFIKDVSPENTMAPLIILSEISAVIPKSIYFEVSDYKYQDSVLNIVADTNSKESVNKIIELISSIKNIKNVQKKSEAIKAGTNGNLISFSLVATIQQKE